MQTPSLKYSLIILPLIVLLNYSCALEPGNQNSNPNVIIILADDLGYGDITAYNPDATPTPRIDQLANEGVRLTNFYVPTPYCAPSRATLLTGRFPLRHGMIRNPTPDAGVDDGLNPDELTLAEVLREAGYQTKCIGKWHLGHFEEFFPVNHGFDEYYGILYSNDMRPVQVIENLDTVMYPVDQRFLTKMYTEEALKFIEKKKNEPFYLQLNHAMPHKPLAASEDFYTPETPDDLYADVIRELDWSIGQVTDKLENLGLIDNTILIFLSDNGPWYGGSTGGLKGMKATTWEGGTRVPFIIRYPERFTKNTIIDVPCWSPDIYPTILSMTGVIPGKLNNLDGVAIDEILNGNQSDHPPIFGMINDRIMSVRHGDYKLFIQKPRFKRLPQGWIDPRGPDGTTILAQMEQAGPEDYPGIIPEESANEIQLFNLKNDISESIDLSEQEPEKVEELLTAVRLFKEGINN